MTQDPRIREWAKRWAANAPPLTQQQRDLIAAAFCGALRPRTRPDGKPQ